MATRRSKDRRQGGDAVAAERRGRERRVHQRILVDLEVDYRSEETFLFAYITDISAMGIFIRTNSPERPGTRLNLRFRPPGLPQLELEGSVRWVNPFRPGDYDNLNPGMGVQFENLTADQRDQLVNLVRTFAYLSDDRERPKKKSTRAGAEKNRP